jgi:hypothetical protein
MAITREDIETCRRLLATYAQRPDIRIIMGEEEYVSRNLNLSRGRTRRLIVAARQDITTNEVRQLRGSYRRR